MTDAPATAAAHSDIGASTMSRLIACPASYGLTQQARARGAAAGGGSSVYAATGTVAHALIEDAMVNGYDPASQLDEVVTVDGHDVRVDAEMIDGTRTCVEEYKRRGAGATLTALETRVCLDPYWGQNPPPVSAFGTCDFWAYHGMTLHLDMVDYKNGAGVFVDVTDNPQLYYYAAGVLLELADQGLPPPVTVDMTIVQPNVRGSDKVRSCKTTALDVLIWVDEVLKPTVAEALTPGARIAAGKHCRFCPVKASCPALSQIAQDLARRDFGPSVDAPVVWNVDELGDVLRDQELIQPHLEALREDALTKIQGGTPVPGWSVVPSRPMRSWSVGPPELMDALEKAGFQDVYGRVLAPRSARTPAQMEKLLTPEEWAIVEPFVQSKSSGVRLVPDAADPAGANSARPSARDEFA